MQKMMCVICLLPLFLLSACATLEDESRKAGSECANDPNSDACKEVQVEDEEASKCRGELEEWKNCKQTSLDPFSCGPKPYCGF